VSKPPAFSAKSIFEIITLNLGLSDIFMMRWNKASSRWRHREASARCSLLNLRHPSSLVSSAAASSAWGRVTKLGEFSPNWREVYYVHFFKLQKYACISGLLFPRLWLSVNFDKNGLDYILGYFFKNSSGHPGARSWNKKKSLTSAFLSKLWVKKITEEEPEGGM
jgi:hypothetical protein